MSNPTPVSENPPVKKTKKFSAAKIGSAIGGLLIIGFILLGYRNGTSIFDLGSCFSSREGDTFGCIMTFIGKSSGFVSVKQDGPTTLTYSKSKGEIPTYTNATPISAPPDFLKDSFENSDKYQKMTVSAYKTKDSSAQVKTFFSSGFKNNGWVEIPIEQTQDTVKAVESIGGFYLGYSYANKTAALLGIPSIYASQLKLDVGATGPDDFVFIVISAE
jgi:hypothetical protein